MSEVVYSTLVHDNCAKQTRISECAVGGLSGGEIIKIIEASGES